MQWNLPARPRFTSGSWKARAATLLLGVSVWAFVLMFIATWVPGKWFHTSLMCATLALPAIFHPKRRCALLALAIVLISLFSAISGYRAHVEYWGKAPWEGA